MPRKNKRQSPCYPSGPCRCESRSNNLTSLQARKPGGRRHLTLASCLALLTALAFTACAPSLQELLDDHHFNEAVCAAHDTFDPAVESRVTSTLETELNPAVHVAALSDAELRPLFGQWTDDVLRKLVILHVTYEVNEAPLDRSAVYVNLRGDGESFSWVYPSRHNLAAALGETLPGPTIAEDPWAGARSAAGLGAAVVLPMATIIDLGTLDLFSLTERMEEQIENSGRREHMVYPTDQEYRQQAPRSDLVYRLALGIYGPRYEEGIHHGYIFFERPTQQHTRLQLEVSAIYAANRIAESGLTEGQCILFSDPAVFEIPDVRRIEEAVQGIFGQRMLTITDLRSMAATRSR